MRLCVLTTSYPQRLGDTAGVFVHTLVRHLHDTGAAEPVVVAPHGPGLARHELLDAIPVRRFRYAWPARLQRLAYGTGIPANLRRSRFARVLVAPFLCAYLLYGWFWSRRCDLIHANWTVSGLIAVLCKRLTGRPVVVTLLGSDIALARRSRVLRAVNRYVFSRADRVIVVGSVFRDELLAMGLPTERIAVIPNGVNPQQFAHVDPGPLNTLLFVGRLAAEKRVDLLLDAFHLVRKQHADARLLVVGDGVLRPNLERHAERLGIASDVTFLGTVPHEQLADIFARAGVFCLTSSHEGLPHSVLEAMAAGLSVVATDVGAVRDVVRTDETGVLVPVDIDAARLADAIDQLIREPQRARRLAQAGRDVVQTPYAWSHIAERLRQLYDACLKGTP